MNSWTQSFENALISHVQSLLPTQNVLQEATLYSLKTPGKRIRPQFVAEAATLVHVSEEASRLLQFAVELVHTFSLVHDDLPCMDNDDLRRGLPTVHKKFNEAQALLTGDLLFQLAMQTLLQAAPYVQTGNFLRGVQYFVESIGPKGLIAGQSAEFEKLGKMTDEELVAIQDQKTSALFRAAILTPYFWAGKTEADHDFKEALDFANAFGFAFQIADDLEDATQDQKTGTKNILSIYGVSEAKALARERLASSRLANQFGATRSLLEKLR